MRNMSLTEDELKVIDSDKVFTKAQIYIQRNCDTCRLTRPAKAHHCNHCGFCINGFDHHCVALNNCVGRRNIRSFYLFLVVSLCYSVITVVNCIAQTRGLNSWIGLASGLVLFIIIAVLIVPARFKNMYRMILGAFGFIACVAMTAATATKPNQWVASFLLYICFVYISVIQKMVGDYVSLTSNHLTLKEREARQKCVRDNCIKDELKSQQLTFKRAMQVNL